MASFTPGDIVVYRVGTGSSTLSNAATAVFLDEYSTSGILVQTIALPTTDSGANQAYTDTGTGTSAGFLTLSGDRRYLLMAGYDTGLGTANVASSSTGSNIPSYTNNRVIARVSGDGTVDTTTTLGTADSSNNIRSAVSENGTAIYASGGGGVFYTTFGSTATPTTLTIQNSRVLGEYGGQLYESSSSSSIRLATIGTGEPTTSGQAVNNLPGLPTTTGSPYSFYLADLSPSVRGYDTLYLADDTTSGGQIQKYSLVSGNWVANGAFADTAVRGLTGSVANGLVTLFTTTGGSSTSGGGSLDRFVDTGGYNQTIAGSLTHLATAATNTSFRGVAFAPTAAAALPTVTVSSPSVSEGDSGTVDLTFTVTASSAAPSGGISFSYATADGTATQPGDYTALQGNGRIEAGATSTTVTVQVIGDTTYEADETLKLNLTAIANAANTTASGTGTIMNDDAAADTTPPTLASATPANAASDVAIGANVVLTFSEAVQAGSGTIVLHPEDGSADIAIAVGDTTQVTFSGSTVTVNPTADLRPGVVYSVELAAGVVTDTAGNGFAGQARDTLDFTTSFAIPSGSQATTFTIQDPGTFTLAAGATRTQTAGGAVAVTAATGGTTNVDVEGTLTDAATSQVAIAYANNAGTITVGAAGQVQSLNQNAIVASSVNGTVNLTNLGQILATSTVGTPAVGGTNPGTEFAVSYNAAKGASGAGAGDFTSGGTITNGSAGNTAALIRSDNGDAIRLGSHETLVNYGTIDGHGPVNDSSSNNGFNGSNGNANTSTATTYDVSRGVRINQSGATAIAIQNYGTITGAQHGLDTGVANATGIVVTNFAGGQITGRNGSGVGADTTGAAANTYTVNNYGTIEGDYAPQYDRAGYVAVDGDGDGVDIDGGATINNYAGARILATGAGGYDGNGRANQSEGISIGGGAIVNAGIIQGAGAGIIVNNDANPDGSRSGIGATTITNDATGSITGQATYAIRFENKTGTAADNDAIVNYGTIIGNGAVPTGTVLRQDGNPDPGTVGTLNGVTYTTADAGNARFIRGDGAAIQMGEGNDTLSNYGAITGTAGNGKSGLAISLEGGDDTLTLHTGSSVSGGIDGGAGNDTLVLALDDRAASGADATTGNNSGVTTGTLAAVGNVEILDVQGGTWTIADAQTYGTGVTIEGPATLVLATGAALTGAITDAGHLTSSATGAVTLANLITGAGIVEQAGSGTLTLTNGGNSYSGGTTLTAGTLDVAGAAGTGAITFGTGAQTLRVETAAVAGGAFANALVNFGTDGDVIDAAGIGLATASYNAATGVLTLTGSATETFAIGAGYGNDVFTTVSDGNGGTNVTVASTTPATLSIANASIAEGNTGATSLLQFTVTSSVAAPASGITFHISTADGTATTADGDYVALTDQVVTIASGQTSATVNVTVNGDNRYEADETLTATISQASGTASVDAAHATATGTIVNDDIPGTFALAGNVLANEDAGAQAFTVTRSGGTTGSVTLTYTVTPSGAHPADAGDFTGGVLPSGTITFADGDASAHTISIPVAADAAYEPDESYTITLSNPTSGGVLGTATATGTIVNDDAAPTLTINNQAIVEGDAGTKTLVFTVTSSAAIGSDIAFHYATADGTATAGSDYVAASGTGTIAAGQTSTTIAVTVNGDTAVEPNETLFVDLDTPVNAALATTRGTGTIVTDDLVSTATLLSTDFTGFQAKGFAPGATIASGQLDSNIWRVVGLSDNTNPAYGFTGPAGGDFGRGVIDSTSATAAVKDPVSAGVYYPVNNAALVFQPTGAELDVAGFIEARLANTTGQTITSIDAAFDWAYRNSAARADNLELFYSTDGVNFTAVPQTAFSTPGAADATLAANFTNQHESIHLDNVVVGNGGNLYLRWEHLSSTGGGSRDEVGIDNVTVTANLSSAPAISVSDVAKAEGNAGQTDFVFTLTRSDPTGTASVQYATADGTARAGSDYQATQGTATFADGQLTTTVTVHVNGDTANEANESFYLNLSNPSAGLTLPDPQGLGTIQNDDTGPVAIYDIQGAGQMSPFAGQNVTTTGVVTRVVAHGFYLQDPTGDNNDATSDGIYVFVGAAATPTVVAGNAVSVAGTIAEYVGGTNNLPITELNTTNAQVTVTAQVGATITPVLISTDGDGRAPPTQVVEDNGFTTYNPATQGADFYESLEGMLVTVKNPLVVGNTYQGSTFVVASQGHGATGLNSRDGLTLEPTDQQPEKIKIFDTTQNHAQGEILGNVTGVLTYYAGEYEVDPVQTVTSASAGKSAADTAREATGLLGDAGHLSYASFNLENLSPVPDANGNDTQAKIDARFATHANEVVNALHSPDIISVQEVQDNDGDLGTTALSGVQTAQKLIDAIVAAGGPAYQYIEIAPTANGISGGDPNGNIRNGFLYNPLRVGYVDGSAHRLDNSVFAGTRYPLVADFTFNGQTFTAIDQHSTSRGGSDPVYASIQPPTQAGDGSRTAQADAIQQYIIQQHQADPNHLFVVNGDFNGYYYEKALTDLVTGTDMSNLYGKLAPEERYSYYFDGTYEAFDNIVVSNSLYGDTSFDVVHYNAGYADGLSTTDHDQVVATIGLARSGGAAVAIADRYQATAAAILHGTVLANDTGSTGLVVAAINGDASQVGVADRLASGAIVTVKADGTFAYDTDGAFAALAAGATATDSFSYTLASGSTATATITITGIATPAADANGHINGTAGSDSFVGTTAANYFDLSAGGDDTVDGGAGNDLFYMGGALTAADHIAGGSGNDQVGLQGDYTGSHALVLSATTLTDVETLALLPGGGTPHSYVITSNDATVAAGQMFTVFATNLAAGENLTFNGAAETDGSFMFYGGAGVDTLTGGAKDDLFYFGPDRFGPNDVVHGGGGRDQLGLDGHAAALTLDATHTDVETVALINGPGDTYGTITIDDSWVAAGETKTVTAVTSFHGYAGPVTAALVIDGSHETSGSLNIYGGSGGDTISGGAGADHLFGGLGADTLTGGAAADVFIYNSAAESTGPGFDTISDFTFGSDVLQIAGQAADTYTSVTQGKLDQNSFDADLQAAVGAQLSPGHAVFFTASSGSFAGQTFLVVDANGSAGYQDGGDYVIHVPAAPVTPAGNADFIIP